MALPISPFLTALGGFFQGYGQDRQYNQQRSDAADAAERQQQIDDFNRRLALARAGYSPVGTGAPSPAAGGPNLPPSPGMAPHFAGLGAPSASGDVVTAPFASGNQDFAFDFDRTTEGQIQKRVLAREQAAAADTTKRDQAKADTAAKTTSLQQRRSYNTLRAEFPNDPLARQPFSAADDGPDYGSALANARDVQKQVRTASAGQSREHWVQAGVDQASGQPLLLNTATGETKVGGGIKPTGAGGGMGGSQAPVADMEARLAEIRQHASNLAQGKGKVTPTMQTREGLTYGIARDNAAGRAPVGKQLAASAMDLFGIGKGGSGGKDFAEYQALMNSTRALGDDAAKVFKGRQNEEAVLREVALGELTPDDYNNPQVVQQKLSRLQHVVDMAKITMPGGMARGPQPSPSSGRPGASTHPFGDLIPQ